MGINPNQLPSLLAGSLAPVYLLGGSEPLLLQECRDQVIRTAQEQGFAERNVHEVGRGFDWGLLLEGSAELSLFASRKIIDVSGADLDQPMGNSTLGKALMAPTTIYVKALLQLFQELEVKALSHITGGGLLENLPRVLPDDCNARINTASWQWPEVCHWLQTQGNVETREMYRTFNCGVGMVVCVAPEDSARAIASLQAAGHEAWEIGSIVEGDNQVELLP